MSRPLPPARRAHAASEASGNPLAYIGVVDVDDLVADLNGQVTRDAVAPELWSVSASKGVDLEFVSAGTGHGGLPQAQALKVEGAQIAVAGGDVGVTPEVALREVLVVPVLNVAARTGRPRRARGRVGDGGRGLAGQGQGQKQTQTAPAHGQARLWIFGWARPGGLSEPLKAAEKLRHLSKYCESPKHPEGRKPHCRPEKQSAGGYL